MAPKTKSTHRERHLLGVVVATARPGLALLHDGHQHRGERHIVVHLQPVGAMDIVYVLSPKLSEYRRICLPGFAIVAEAALGQLSAAHGLHVEERPYTGQRLAGRPVSASADVGQAPVRVLHCTHYLS